MHALCCAFKTRVQTNPLIFVDDKVFRTNFAYMKSF